MRSERWGRGGHENGDARPLIAVGMLSKKEGAESECCQPRGRAMRGAGIRRFTKREAPAAARRGA